MQNAEQNKTSVVQGANSDRERKVSHLSPTLLSNYVLAISLLKNMALKRAFPDALAQSFEQNM